MATYTISPLYKKSAIERTYYFKDDQCIIREEGFRWGSYTGEFDERPDIDLTDDIDMMGMEGWEFDMLDDGCWLDWEFPDNMSEEEQQVILDAYDENYDDGLQELGWSSDEYECLFQAPLKLECEETGEVWTGDDDVEEENIDIDLDGGISSINEGDATPSAAWPFPTGKAP